MEKRDIVIIGAGGFGREVVWLIERINEKAGQQWNILGFVDDGVEEGVMVQGYPVLGTTEYLLHKKEEISVACAIGNAQVRKKVIDKIMVNDKLDFPNLIDPSVIMSGSSSLGKGNIICANTIITVNVLIGDFTLINLSCTIGHETEVKSFATLFPGVNVSGNVVIETETEIGTATCIIPGKTVGSRAIVGAGAVVIRDIPEGCTAVGNPARIIK